MSSLEITKIIGAVLTAGIVASFAGFVSHLVVQPEQLAEHAYPVEGVVSEEATAAEVPAAAAPEPASVLPLLAAADAAAGEKAVRKCTSCHTLDEGGANKIGPNLWNIVGRPIASAGGYSYSGDLQGKSGESWTYENLDGFLSKPKDWAPGTKMSFAGLKKVKDRADLIAYLRSLSASPAPLPE
jgi:cytochrome c